MALYTTECGVVARRRMAIRTLIPGLMVCAAVNREILAIVVKRRWRPGILAVTDRAISREARRNVVRAVARGAVIGRMTAVTGIGCIRVVAVVAGIAVVGNGRMRAHDRINRVVVEGRWRPGRLAVAGSTIGRELRCCVVWVGGSRIVSRVAAVAGVGRIVVIAVVADGTVAGNGSVCTLQHIIVIVHGERSRVPVGIGRMASRAIRR